MILISKVSLLVILLMLVLVRSFSCTPDDTSIEVFLTVTLLMLVLVRCLSYAPPATFSDEVFLQS